MKNALRFASLVVILCLCVTSCAYASGNYANSIETIWANYAKGSASATSNEQLVNGTYRSFEMLYVIDSMLDDGSMTGQLDTIWDKYVDLNSASESVIDQAANGAYRTFEAAYLMALAVDTNGTYAKALNSVWSSYESGNTSSTSASQRLVNGSYRTFEAFYILAHLLDTQSTYSESLKSIYSIYNSENKTAKSDAGLAANGFYRTFEVCYIVASLLDTQYLYADSLDSIWATYESAHKKADSYTKMQLNGANRTFETLYVIAQLLSQDTASPASRFTDEETGVSFAIPDGWIEIPVVDNNPTVKIQYTPSNNVGKSSISFAVFDFYTLAGLSQKGLTRKEVDFSYLVDDLVEAMLWPLEAKSNKIKMYGGYQYKVISTTIERTQLGLTFSYDCEMVLTMVNGYVFMFQYAEMDHNEEYYSAFENMLFSVQLPLL